ncbi:hypothetical protein Q3G72_032869 [Acer saccharum]|nr:hypothetical protein Q3G72_032869 [Acer saccharum]
MCIFCGVCWSPYPHNTRAVRYSSCTRPVQLVQRFAIGRAPLTCVVRPTHLQGKGSALQLHKTTTTDDKRLQSTLKRIGVNVIPAIEEVNIFKDDVVIQFLNPQSLSLYCGKYMGSIGAGAATTQEDDVNEVQELMAGETFEVAAEEKTEPLYTI